MVQGYVNIPKEICELIGTPGVKEYPGIYNKLNELVNLKKFLVGELNITGLSGTGNFTIFKRDFGVFEYIILSAIYMTGDSDRTSFTMSVSSSTPDQCEVAIKSEDF